MLKFVKVLSNKVFMLVTIDKFVYCWSYTATCNNQDIPVDAERESTEERSAL